MNINPLGIIFSDTHAENLQDLTAVRTTASIPFGGRYRLIDFPLSNMVNSGISKIGVITKSNYQSLLDHINSGKEWDLSHKHEGLYILPPYGREYSRMYSTRLEALNGVHGFIRQSNNEYVVLSDCDVIMNCNLRQPLEYHILKSADITVVYGRRRPETNSSKAVSTVEVDDDGRVSRFMINPQAAGESNVCLNIWIVNKNFLERVIADADALGYTSWERDVLQKNAGSYKIYAWEFKGYAGQIGTMRDYYRINMETLDMSIREELFFRYGHIFTKVRDEVPAKYGSEADVTDSSVADGCVIEGKVDHSVIFRDVRIGPGCNISNSIIMQGTHVGANVTLNCVITDKDVFISDNRTMMGYQTCPIYISKASIV